MDSKSKKRKILFLMQFTSFILLINFEQKKALLLNLITSSVRYEITFKQTLKRSESFTFVYFLLRKTNNDVT